jgi:Leucine-rich repeat (LRR) protein
MKLTTVQIEKGIWLFNDIADWDQKIIKFPNQYKGEERIMLDCTQLRAAKTYKEEKKLIDEWCDFFPSMKNLKYLYFESRLTQNLFNSICDMDFLEGLYFKWSNITDISRISDLSNLKHLHIGSSPKIADISALSKMNSLLTLEIENIKVLNNISFICDLTYLEGLGINGSLWTTQTIASLNPIQKLKHLKFITLYGTKVLDGSLKPLATLKSLERIWIAPFYKKEEYDYIINNLPGLKYGNIKEILIKINNKVSGIG